MRIRATLLALIALACCAAPARAASGSFEVPVAPDSAIPELAGPQPAGDVVAYAAGSADAGWSVRVGAPGVAATRELQAIAPERGLTLGLSASGTRVAVTQHAEYCTDCRYMSYVVTHDAVSVAPLGVGAPADLVRCERGSCAESGCAAGRQRFTTALSGDVLAVLDACSATARLVDLATGAARPLGPASAVAVAGRFVAVAQPGPPPGDRTTIVVTDVDSGAEVYRAGVPAAGVFALSGPAVQLALRADGAVVYLAAGTGYDLVAAAPSLPAGRIVRSALPASTILGLGPAGAVLLDTRTAALQLVGLDGSSAMPFTIPDLVGTPAFDGDTIAWARRTCATTTITSWRVGEAPPPVADLRCATPRATSAAATLSHTRRLPVALVCPATARGGCSATVRLIAQRRGRAARGVNGASRVYRLGQLAVRLNPGERRTTQLLVPVGAARWVRRHAPLRLRIEIASDRLRTAQRPAGDGGVSVRTVALRAAR